MLCPVKNTNQEVALYNDAIYKIQRSVIDRMHQRTKVLQTNSNMLELKKQLNFTQSCMPITCIEEQITRDDNGKLASKTINLQKRQGLMNTTYYNIGMRVEGGLINFYVVDRCQVKLCESAHGDFITLEGDNYPMYINIYQGIMASTLLKQFLMINKTKLMTLGKDDLAKKTAVLQKFYVATVDDNEEIYATGELKEDQMLTITPMTMETFDSLFTLGPMKKSTDAVEFVVGSVIVGVNKGVSRDEVYLMDGSSDSNTSVYALNVDHKIFIYFENKCV